MPAWILLFAPILIAQSAILEQALSNEAKQLKEREKYFYREHAEHRRPGGKLNFTKDYEWIFLEGKPYRRMVARNGKPLNLKTAVRPRQRRTAPMFTPLRAVLRNHLLGEVWSICAAQ